MRWPGHVQDSDTCAGLCVCWTATHALQVCAHAGDAGVCVGVLAACESGCLKEGQAVETGGGATVRHTPLLRLLARSPSLEPALPSRACTRRPK